MMGDSHFLFYNRNNNFLKLKHFVTKLQIQMVLTVMMEIYILYVRQYIGVPSKNTQKVLILIYILVKG